MYRVADIQQYIETLNHVRETGRTPLVISSVQNPIESHELSQNMGHEGKLMQPILLKALTAMCAPRDEDFLKKVKVYLRDNYL